MVLMAAHRSPKPRVWVQILVPLPYRACSTRSARDGRDGINPQVGFDVHETTRSYRLPFDGSWQTDKAPLVFGFKGWFQIGSLLDPEGYWIEPDRLAHSG